MSNIIEYTGLPKQPNRPGEATLWAKFCSKILPWLGKKASRADKYADAVLQEKVLQTELLSAEIEQTKQATALLAAQSEKEKWEAYEKQLDFETKVEAYKKGQAIDVKAEVIKETIEDLENKLQQLRMLGGGLLKAEAKQPNKKISDAKPTSRRKPKKKKKP